MKHFYLLIIAVFFSIQLHSQNAPFITTWEVTAGDLGITIPTAGTGYNYTIDFGDGTVQHNVSGNVSHLYSNAGIYTVSITGSFPRIYFNNSLHLQPNKILSVEQWGDQLWSTMENSFWGCANLVINATDAPNLSQVINMSRMFRNSSINQSINHWNVSNVTNMQEIFRNAIYFNQPLNSWDVSNVTNFEMMFRNANSFNQPLNSWNTSSAINMAQVFMNATSFNQPLNNWNVSNVTNMSSMFGYATSFNQPLNSWDVSNVNNMGAMFVNATSFNQPLNNWDVSNVNNMGQMFNIATSFNQPLNNWNVSNLTNINSIFSQATSFNQPLNNWDVSSVTSFWFTFSGATSFNQPLDNWDVSNSTGMRGMFSGAASFNQPLNNWDVSNVDAMNQMFNNATSFNQPLDNWDVSNVNNMNQMFKNATSFNQSINQWNVSNVIYMHEMFWNATSFNQPLNNWDVSNISHMNEMFKDASSFNQPLNNWVVSNVYNMEGMFNNATSFNQNLSDWNFPSHMSFASNYGFIAHSGLDVENYEVLLLKFAKLGFKNKLLLADGLSYCATGVRDYLINNLGWMVQGDGLSPDCNLITGTILYDQNNNGCDPNDIELDGFMVNASDGTNDFITYSNNGNYNLRLYSPNCTVSVVNQPSYFTVNPASVPVVFTTSQTEIVDFCVTANQSIEDLNITLLPLSEARPGFEADYRLVIKNVGTETIANVVTTLEFDNSMQQFVVANPAPGSTTTNTLTFPIGNMQPFQTIDIDITMLTFQPPTVEGDDILNFLAEVTPSANDHTPNDNIYNLAQVVVNSYDPNDKQVLQGEELHIDDVNEYLDYLIRFQNTGTASAINVRILDTLHPKLDWSTLKPISASHNYYVKIKDGNRVEFMFDNIHLPDSISNEPASHGFVAYKIKPKNNVQIGDIISGDAGIYFDFNPPIITNMVHTQIVNPLSLAANPNPLNQITVYPNPTNKTLHIFLTDNIQLEEVSIYDLQGKEVQKLQGKEKTFNVENLNQGMYFLKITTDRGVVNRKLVKE